MKSRTIASRLMNASSGMPMMLFGPDSVSTDLNKFPLEQFARVMNSVGVFFLREGMDFRSPQEHIRSQRYEKDAGQLLDEANVR